MMSKFVKVKDIDCRYTQSGGHDVWLNLNQIIIVDEKTKMVYMTHGNTIPISDDSMAKLIEVLKNRQGVMSDGKIY